MTQQIEKGFTENYNEITLNVTLSTFFYSVNRKECMRNMLSHR